VSTVNRHEKKSCGNMDKKDQTNIKNLRFDEDWEIACNGHTSKLDAFSKPKYVKLLNKAVKIYDKHFDSIDLQIIYKRIWELKKDTSFDNFLKKSLTVEELKDFDSLNNKTIYLDEYIFDLDELPQQIDHALGFVEVKGTKFRYFGFFLNKTKTDIIKGVEFKKTVKESALFLENRTIIDKSSGVKFEFSSQMGIKKNRISEKYIQEIKQGLFDNITFKDVYFSVKKHFDQSMIYEDQQTYIVLSLWVMVTYFQDLVNKALILKFEGVSGAGKSKSMRILANLCFNGKKFLCPTASNFFRYRHNNKSTLLIEEAERLFSNTKNKEDSELVEYLNGSYEKGNFVPRQNDKNINQTDEFDPFGFTAIGSIKEIKGALEKRSITINQIIAPKNDKRADIEIETDSEEFIQTRVKLYSMGLFLYRDFLESQNKILKIEGFANREWALVKPLLAICELIDLSLTKQVSEYLLKKLQMNTIVNTSEIEMIALKSIIELSSLSYDQEVFISYQDILDKFNSKLPVNYKPYKTNSLTKIINSLGYKDFHARSGDRTKRGYFWTLRTILKISVRNQKLTKHEIINFLSEMSQLSENDDIVNKIEDLLSDNLSDNLSGQNTNFENKNNSDKRDKKDNFSEGYGINDKKQQLFEIISEKGSILRELAEKDFGSEYISQLCEERALMESPSGVLRLAN